jgi:hypothetical protein
MKRLSHWFATLTFALAMTACGGGGGGTNQPAGLLAGDTASPALAAVVNVAAQPAADADIVNGAILTRLNVVFAADATVGQVNAALGGIGATIAAARAGAPALTIAVPRQASADALAALAATLAAQPGIVAALPGADVVLNVAPPGSASADADFLYLQRARFPAAWNARSAAGNCANNKVTVIVADAFLRPIDVLYAQFADRPGQPGQVPGVADLGSGSAPRNALDPNLHGYDVLTTLAAKLDATVPTGANPFPDCMDLKAVQISGLDLYSIMAEIEAALATSTGKVVVNASFGFRDQCGTPNAAGAHPPCTPANVFAPKAHLRAIWAAMQRRLLAPFADRALVVSAAGNEANKPIAAAYLGAGLAPFGSAFNIAATADGTMSFGTDRTKWEPTPACTTPPCLPSLTATPLEAIMVERTLFTLGSAAATPAANVLIAGSVDNLQLQHSEFSDFGAPVLAVGEGIPTLPGVPVQGTSFAAPQVAGLAAYLWMLSPDLRARPAKDTVALIQANASKGLRIDGVTIADGLINAYASVLSLDEAVPVTPSTAKIRLAILDVGGSIDSGGNVVGDGRFDLTDLQVYRAFYLNTAGAPVEPTARDHSRFDLNGDGFTGGSHTTRMDLDPNGSTRFGAQVLGTVSAQIGGATRSFNETAVTDAQALCFYAHSALYTGDAAARDTVLAPLCSGLAGARLSGSLSLTATTVATNLTLVTSFSIDVTAQVDSGGAIEVLTATGSGSETFTYVSSAVFSCGNGVTASGRPPETKAGNAIRAAGTFVQDGDPLAQASIRPTFSGSKTTTRCSATGDWSTGTTPFEGDLSGGTLLGTPVVVNGSTVAIDFNRNFVDAFGKHFVMSGRLQRN